MDWENLEALGVGQSDNQYRLLGLLVEEIIMSNMNWTLVIMVNMSAGGSGHSWMH